MSQINLPRVEHDKARMLVLAGLLFSLGVSSALNRIPFIRAKSDIYQRWYATTKLITEDRNLYDERNGAEVLQLVYGDDPVYETTNFYYPAHLLLFTAPLALLPYPAAHLIWTTAVQLFYLGALWLLSRRLHWPDSVNQTTLFLILSVLFLPNLQHTIWSQFNTIGVLSFVLCYLALRQERFGAAGVWAVGLTFKPQATLLPLAFLLIWALWQKRWRFHLGFLTTSVGLWAFAEWLQPGWVLDFMASLNDYEPVQSVIDQIWNPNQLLSGLSLLVMAVIIIKNRHMPADSLTFAGCLIASITVWILVFPLIGMMHIVLIPPAVILLVAGLQQSRHRWYRPTLYLLVLVYSVGWIGFIWGLSDQVLYGLHIDIAEWAYKAALPVIILFISLPFCLQEKYKTERLIL